MHRPSPALAIALLALFVALDGPAAAQRAASSIAGSRLKSNSVTGAKIRNGSLSASDLSSRARAQLRVPGNRTVSATKLRPNAVGAPAIANDAVNTPDLNQGAVTSEKLATGAVGVSKLGDDAVNGAKVADGSLGARDVASVAGEAIIDFPSLAPGGCAALPFDPPGDVSVPDDVVALTAPANLPDAVQATTKLGPGDKAFTVVACNHSGAAIDPERASFRYAVLAL